jgi:NADH-quinone oxidoreductase subunit A
MGIDQNIVFWPFIVFAIVSVILVASMIVISWFLGERHKEKKTDEPYESGIAPTGNARLRFSSHFYLIAMFFVIFDLEAAFIMAWAVSFRELGVAGYVGMLIFIGILMVVLVYELSIGSLDFGPPSRKILKFKDKFRLKE